MLRQLLIILWISSQTLYASETIESNAYPIIQMRTGTLPVMRVRNEFNADYRMPELELAGTLLVKPLKWDFDFDSPERECYHSKYTGWLDLSRTMVGGQSVDSTNVKQTILNAMIQQHAIIFRFDRQSLCPENERYYLQPVSFVILPESHSVQSLSKNPDLAETPEESASVSNLLDKSKACGASCTQQEDYDTTEKLTFPTSDQHCPNFHIPTHLSDHSVYFDADCKTAFIGPAKTAKIWISHWQLSPLFKHCGDLAVVEKEMRQIQESLSPIELLEKSRRIHRLKTTKMGSLSFEMTSPYVEDSTLNEFSALNPDVIIERLRLDDARLSLPKRFGEPSSFALNGFVRKTIDLTLAESCDLFTQDKKLSQRGLDSFFSSKGDHQVIKANATSSFKTQSPFQYEASYDVQYLVKMLRAESGLYANYFDELVKDWQTRAEASFKYGSRELFSFRVTSEGLKAPDTHFVEHIKRKTHLDFIQRAAQTFKQQLNSTSPKAWNKTPASSFERFARQTFNRNVKTLNKAMANYFCNGESNSQECARAQDILRSIAQSFGAIDRIKVFELATNLEYKSSVGLFTLDKQSMQFVLEFVPPNPSMISDSYRDHKPSVQSQQILQDARSTVIETLIQLGYSARQAEALYHTRFADQSSVWTNTTLRLLKHIQSIQQDSERLSSAKSHYNYSYIHSGTEWADRFIEVSTKEIKNGQSIARALLIARQHADHQLSTYRLNSSAR